MKSKKISMFKFVNMWMIVFCICAMCMNYVGVNVRGTNAATSSINGNNFEYTVLDNSLEFKRNGNLIGSLPMDKKMYIRNDNLLFQSNAIVVVAKAAAADAAIAAGGVGALMSAFVVPVLIAAGVGAGIM